MLAYFPPSSKWGSGGEGVGIKAMKKVTGHPDDCTRQVSFLILNSLTFKSYIEHILFMPERRSDSISVVYCKELPKYQ